MPDSIVIALIAVIVVTSIVAFVAKKAKAVAIMIIVYLVVSGGGWAVFKNVTKNYNVTMSADKIKYTLNGEQGEIDLGNIEEIHIQNSDNDDISAENGLIINIKTKQNGTKSVLINGTVYKIFMKNQLEALKERGIDIIDSIGS